MIDKNYGHGEEFGNSITYLIQEHNLCGITRKIRYEIAQSIRDSRLIKQFRAFVKVLPFLCKPYKTLHVVQYGSTSKPIGPIHGASL